MGFVGVWCGYSVSMSVALFVCVRELVASLRNDIYFLVCFLSNAFITAVYVYPIHSPHWGKRALYEHDVSQNGAME